MGDILNDQIRKLIDTIYALEDELRTLLNQQQTQFAYKIAGKRVEFEKSIRDAHKKLKTSWLYWLVTLSPKHLLSGPFIYGLIFPLLIFDLGLSLYHSVCFRLYGIALVKRENYIIYDHHHLAYLNVFEKINCLYCSYAAGLINYGREIAARTEQYWCPIKHAHKLLEPHHRYAAFLDYGDAENYQKNMLKVRAAVTKIK